MSGWSHSNAWNAKAKPWGNAQASAGAMLFFSAISHMDDTAKMWLSSHLKYKCTHKLGEVGRSFAVNYYYATALWKCLYRSKPLV